MIGLSKTIERSLLIFLVSVGIKASGQNKLLDRNFWKDRPTLEKVKLLVEEGHNPTELNSFSFDALSWALIENADSNVLNYLLEFPENDVNKLTHDARTYIFWAAYGNNTSFMRNLIRKGADMSIVDEHGYSLLNFAAVTGNKNKEVYDIILNEGAKPKEELNKDGANALLLLIPFLENDDYVTYFKKYGLDINDLDKHGANAALYAAKGGHLEFMDWLNSKGIDFTLTDAKGRNAAHYAAQGLRRKAPSLETFEYLKKIGIPLNLQSNNGQTALTILSQGRADKSQKECVEFLVEQGNDIFHMPEEGRSAFLNLVSKWDLKDLEEFSISEDIVNDATSKGETSALIVSKYNNVNVLNWVLNQKADPFVVDENLRCIQEYTLEGFKQGNEADFQAKVELLQSRGVDFDCIYPSTNTIYHFSIIKKRTEILSLLKPSDKHINHINKDGLTALHIACMISKDTESIRTLIGLGASTSIKTEMNETCLELAMENELLVNYHAEIKSLLQ